MAGLAPTGSFWVAFLWSLLCMLFWLYEMTQLLLSSLPDPADLSLWAEPFLAWNPLRN